MFLDLFFFFFNDTATPEIYTLSLHDALPISVVAPSVEEMINRGPLLAYAKDRDGHRYAVLDTGRELSAFRTDAPAPAPGLEIRATSVAGRDARGRQVFGWRLEV